ncbi:MAG: hypothetical protein RIC95_14115 [Vicingaceae bacterium]
MKIENLETANSYRIYFHRLYNDRYEKSIQKVERNKDHLAVFLENQEERILFRKEQINGWGDFSNLLK